MTKFVWAFFAVLSGVLVGLWLTASAVSSPPRFGAIEAGVWVVRAKVGTVDADPYARASHAFRGEIPVAAAEGVGLEARQDGEQRGLTTACDYRFIGPVPTARFWTLTAYATDGKVITSPLRPASFTSSEILRREGGQNEIVLSAQAQPGNWLPLTGTGPFWLMLRLYDTPLSANALALDAASLPRLTRERCR